MLVILYYRKNDSNKKAEGKSQRRSQAE